MIISMLERRNVAYRDSEKEALEKHICNLDKMAHNSKEEITA